MKADKTITMVLRHILSCETMFGMRYGKKLAEMTSTLAWTVTKLSSRIDKSRKPKYYDMMNINEKMADLGEKQKDQNIVSTLPVRLTKVFNCIKTMPLKMQPQRL
ncbi:MAG: hypothetical protein GXY81_00690 [Candidatus Cloacimonetes bacterium]|jgi:hypothetical protein|nr:hypothetical protein [Candidatus Cloacimonadota bacterium]MDX9949264.1 hypothetical protein [Candidatus Syntrophosphaera sp.]NLN84970.1 hypothetical protein [Candidatus Cloacimonadota bacterium]NLW18197.1 hypothetical protein [Candidatus Cloacimonadota bacterium]